MQEDSESDDTETGIGHHKGKSVVSKLHEYALQLRRNVEFEVVLLHFLLSTCIFCEIMNHNCQIVAEEGPAHDKHYVVSCKLISPNKSSCLHADGEGRNKKTAKQAACAALLDRIKDFGKQAKLSCPSMFSVDYSFLQKYLFILENSPIFIAQNLYKNHKKSSQPRDHKRKTIVKVGHIFETIYLI